MAFFLRYMAAIVAALAVSFLVSHFVSADAALWVLAIAAGLYALFSAMQLARLHHWASLPRNRDLPSGFGPWRSVFDRLGRFVRQERETRTDLIGKLGLRK